MLGALVVLFMAHPWAFIAVICVLAAYAFWKA